jgi:dihydropteroate synthase
MSVKIVGILNITPDSFSDGGLFIDPKVALRQAELLFDQGADLIDVGAEATNPKVRQPLSADEEWSRLGPVIGHLITAYPGKISVDSYHPETFERVFKIGPVIVNDITGLNNPKMFEFVVRHKPTVIVCNLAGTDFQSAHKLEPTKSLAEVKDDLLDKAKRLEDSGLDKEQIILDPGIGFGKPPELNKRLVSFASEVPDYNVMIGYSRKRFLGEHRMELDPNLEAAQEAVNSGAAYLRVHDVAGHASFLKKLA